MNAHGEPEEPDAHGEPADSFGDEFAELPVDSDLVEAESGEPAVGDPSLVPASDRRAAKPIHLRWRYAVIVIVGGTVGTALRELLSLVVPDLNGVALVILGINVVGAFLLGALLETLSRSGPDEGRRRRLRLLLGTGVLGGFTTYSTLATGTALLFVNGRPAAAALYAVATLLVGAVATFLGIVVAANRHRRRLDPVGNPDQDNGDGGGNGPGISGTAVGR
ncbi:fluoride efflux transporter FluC [Subtercola frigoramans]|uniref:Fluoride-specific ion channel FluC n=1 Tax=Subtercola frigoramans TaxID=120298 RepID=A0ABS2L190_9MICO|nr:CrcB family protein [Subtercola frigoramans]MBM7470848.1 CrcB protein [Subtercola frigoramans]